VTSIPAHDEIAPRLRKRATAGAAILIAAWSLFGTAAAAQDALPQSTVTLTRADQDPHWRGYGNQPNPAQCRPTTQSFGYRPTTNASSEPGEIGGIVTRAEKVAFYARPIAPTGLDRQLRASGTLNVTDAATGGGLAWGWFSSASQQWRSPSSLQLRLGAQYKPGSRAVVAVLNLDFASRDNFATAYEPNTPLILVPGRVYRWTLTYDPRGGPTRSGSARLAVSGVGARTIDLTPMLRRSGVRFDRFGMGNVAVSGDRFAGYIGDPTLNGESLLPGGGAPVDWIAQSNEETYPDCTHPLNDAFGPSPTDYVGNGPGEIGGLIWGQPRRVHYYAAALRRPIGLAKPLRASGMLYMRKFASDSDTIFLGWFAHRAAPGTIASHGLPRQSVGAWFAGTSASGPRMNPVLRALSPQTPPAEMYTNPLVPPDQAVRWSIAYRPRLSPAGRLAGATLTVRLDGRSALIALSRHDLAGKVNLDRFGLRTMNVAGHADEVYLDELRFSNPAS
jgi:hypothetical protein